MFPFNSLSYDKNFLACSSFLACSFHGSIIPWKEQKTAEISSLLLKPTPNLELLVNHFNNETPENNHDHENIFLLNIKILMKCIMLEYLTKINICPCSI